MRQLTLPGRQRGAVMFVALIMMVVMLLVAISSFNMGRQNTVIAGNMQHRAEVVSAANQTVERVLSTTTFIATPNATLAESGVPANQAGYDINGDGTNDITVALTPAPCIKKAQAIKNADLDPLIANDAACILGAVQTLGVAGSSTGNSLCANSIWEINAVATDNVTGAATTVTTGVAVRVAADDAITAANICPP